MKPFKAKLKKESVNSSISLFSRLFANENKRHYYATTSIDRATTS
jgi:hypothetical protein